MLKKLFSATSLALVLGAVPAYAQLPGLEVEPYLGAYIPLLDQVDQRVDAIGADLTSGQKEGFAIGARLTAWLAGPLGIEGNFTYALSDVEGSTGASTSEESAGVWMGDGRLILKLLPGPLGIHATGGVALIGRTGDAYDGVTEGKTDIGGVVGLGLRIKLPGILGIRGDVDGFIYKAQFTGDFGTGSLETDGKFQVDFVASVGLIVGII